MGSYGVDLLSGLRGSGEAKSFPIVDQCSFLAGQLIHTINIADECSLKCRSECSVLDKEYVGEEFIVGNESCNFCQCNCK